MNSVEMRNFILNADEKYERTIAYAYANKYKSRAKKSAKPCANKQQRQNICKTGKEVLQTFVNNNQVRKEKARLAQRRAEEKKQREIKRNRSRENRMAQKEACDDS
jgi:hypothetical protein